MKKLVLFDLDGTIINNPSSENSYILWLMRTGRLGIKQYFFATKFIFKWIWRFKMQVFVKNKSYLSRLSVNKITQEAQHFTQTYLLSRIRPNIEKLIEQHRANGDIIVLLTGAPEPIAKKFAAHLNITEIASTLLSHENGIFTCLPPKQHPYGYEKLTLAQQICTKHNISIKDAVAYANSIHDQFLLNAVGTPIAVTPDRRLRKIAENKKWEIID